MIGQVPSACLALQTPPSWSAARKPCGISLRLLFHCTAGGEKRDSWGWHPAFASQPLHSAEAGDSHLCANALLFPVNSVTLTPLESLHLPLCSLSKCTHRSNSYSPALCAKTSHCLGLRGCRDGGDENDGLQAVSTFESSQSRHPWFDDVLSVLRETTPDCTSWVLCVWHLASWNVLSYLVTFSILSLCRPLRG